MSSTPLDRLRSKKARQITVGVYLDERFADRLDAAVLARQQARNDHAPASVPDDDMAALTANIAAAQAALDEATFWFTFQGIGRAAFARLVAEHPPTDEDIAHAESRARDRPDFHAATFAPALIAASCIAPAMTLETANSIFEDEAWNTEELGALMAAALSVCARARPLAVKHE